MLFGKLPLTIYRMTALTGVGALLCLSAGGNPIDPSPAPPPPAAPAGDPPLVAYAPVTPSTASSARSISELRHLKTATGSPRLPTPNQWFSTDLYPYQENFTVVPKLSGGWGAFPFGTLPFGVSAAYLQGIPVFLTKNTFMAHWLNISVTMNRAFENMELSGIYAFYDIFGERSR